MPLSREEKRLLESCDRLDHQLHELLAELVRAASPNPPGDTRQAAAVVRELLESAGLEVETLGPRQEAPNLLARLNPGGRPQLVFNSHLDTVPVGDESQWRHPPFGGEVKDGALYGRGAADAKGCLAAMAVAVRALAHSGLALRGELALNPVSDEETGGEQGARWVVHEHGLRPDAAVIGEITSNQVAIAHKGVVWLRIVTHGRSAHASTPWAGVSAIAHMAEIVCQLDGDLRPRLESRRHPLTPPPSVSFGRIWGGVKANVVADRCELELDRRVLPGESVEAAVGEIEAVVASVSSQPGRGSAEVEVILVGSPLETPAESPLVQQALAAARDLGLPDEPAGYQQASDGRFFSELGIPTVLVGPGVPELAHTPDEHVRLEEVAAAVRLYALLAYRWLR